MAACAGTTPPGKTMARLLEAVAPAMQAQRVTALTALTDSAWLLGALGENGFTETDRVISYPRRNGHRLPGAPQPAILRRAGPADTDIILDLNAAAFEPLWRYDPATIITWLTTAEHSVIAELHGRPVGFSLTASPLHGDYTQLIRVAAHPDAQGRGIGRQLVSDAIRYAQECGSTGISLNTQESNGVRA